MKKITAILSLFFSVYFTEAQTNADCVNHIPLCSSPSFTFFGGMGDGQVNDIPSGNNISNPQSNPNPPNAGCLLAGENEPQWLLLTIGNAGTLEFVFGAGNSPNPQVGYYDWAMWPYSPTACQNIMNNTLPPIRCNWNAISSGGTGIASPSNIPIGGNSGNFQPPLNVNACQQFIICISNYSGVNTLVSFQSLGTASLQCNPNCNANYNICAGASVTITAINFSNLNNATYSLQPSGQSNSSGTFVVSPLTTTSYTTYVTGTDQSNAVQTTTGLSTVTVSAMPVVAPQTTQAACGSTLNSVNLNLSWSPPASPPGYTVTWNPVPPGIVSPTQTSAQGLPPGVTNVTVTTSAGCKTVTAFTMSPVPSPADFTVTPGGPYIFTCTNTLITLNNSPNNYTYTWSGLSYTATGTSVTFTSGTQGNYTVVASNGIAGCSVVQTLSIVQNTTAPVNTVNPVSQAVTCNSGSPITFTGSASNPTSNIQHDWYSPLNPLPGGVPIASSNNSVSILSGNIPPGVYTLQTTNLVNGCKTQKTVTITSLSAWPIYSLASPNGFSVGCAPLQQTTINIVNPVSTQTPPATCSYTFLAPGFSGTLPSGVPLGNNSSTVTMIAGTWTIIVQDNSNFCRTEIAVPVIQNTVAPNVSASMAPFSYTLTCKTPTILATGVSTTANTYVNWNVPSTPPLLSTPTVVIGIPANGPGTSTTSTSYANFTVIATNSVNACQTTSVVQVYQNFKPPISSPTISIATPTAIYCTAAVNPAVLTAGNSTTTSGGGPMSFVANPCWAGPAPQATNCGGSSYNAYVPGVYTLTIEDAYNGCTASGTLNVLDKTQPPVIQDAVQSSTLDCGSDQALLKIALAGTTSGGFSYVVIRYPPGAAFSPTYANFLGGYHPVSGTIASSVFVSLVGEYVYMVTNTLTGCTANGTVNVKDGDLTAGFSAEPSFGYPPMDVAFTNNSASSLGSGSITSIWSFGNGSSATNTNNATVNTTYAQPGTYTVSLITMKGSCIDTLVKTIQVDLPSKMEVPNIFTPNGDGVNDVYLLRTANLGEVTALIFDRWGNKIYEVASGTGNIAWDGKGLNGKDSPAGVYLYIIKAKGKDDKRYESKGSITLLR